MDRYGRTQEGSQSDPSREWTGSRPETGLEEAVWHLGLGEGESGYPERPDEADCIYYLRTGVCGFGHRCRFNHPRDRGAVLGAARGGGEFPERIGQPVCQYYMRTGSCKFGASCKYHHPKQGGSSGAPVSLNYYGYPLRPGEKECTYYMKTGQCKFGMTCKFHHPQLTNLPVQAQSLAQQAAPVLAPLPPTALYPALQSHAMGLSQQYGVMVARPPMMQGSYVQSPYGHMLVSPGIVPYPSWNPYAAPVSPVTSPSTQPTVASAAMYGIAQLSPSAPAFIGAYQPMSASTGPSSSSQKENPFPERPGQPECQHYLKTGDCKYGSSCRYHHPPELMTSKTYVALSPMSLPLRPGVTICSHYAQHGHCKYGPQCKYDHPMGTLSDSPSASSLVDMPVAPYPVGSSLGTLAPSSSSSELRPELISGASKESSSTRMASLMSSSSGSVGLVSSKSEKIPPQSSSQHCDQSSAPSSTSAEARTSS